ncbi:MAG: penicillin-binding protein 2 [Planctomycetota bacterium]
MIVPGMAYGGYRRRGTLALLVIGIGFGVLVVRLAWIQVVEAGHYRRLALGQQEGRREISADRGYLYDRNGECIALSRQSPSVCVYPTEMEDPAACVRTLSAALHLEPRDVVRRVSRGGRHFAWIKRQAEEAEAERLRAASLDGIGIIKEPRRYYPRGAWAAHALGFVGVDHHGMAGVERAYDGWLAGAPGYETILRDSRQNVIATLDGLYCPSVPGTSLVLTLDAVIQDAAEEELDRIEKESRPLGATAVAMDPRTGEILALACRPNFDPNRPGNFPPQSFRNRAVTDPYEAGSTFKSFIMEAALAEGVVQPGMRFNCENGVFRYKSRVLHDHKPYGILTLSEILIHSSNIGIVKVGLLLPSETLHGHLRAFGFGGPTGVDIAGESRGILREARTWNDFTRTSIPMGHEIAVTPLQLARAYAVFANGGYLVRPHLVKGWRDGRGNFVSVDGSGDRRLTALNPAALKAVRAMMTDVVAEGTATRAQIEGIPVAGKTGTTQKLGPDGRYSSRKHIASFVGFAPAEAADVLVLVTVDEPRGGAYYGGQVAAPAVRNILEKALRRRGVMPSAPVPAAPRNRPAGTSPARVTASPGRRPSDDAPVRIAAGGRENPAATAPRDGVAAPGGRPGASPVRISP